MKKNITRKQIAKYILYAIIAISVLSISFCKNENGEIVIIYTTDIHGNFFPQDFENDGYDNASFANLSTFVKEQRDANNNNVLLLDCGNLFSLGVENYYCDNIDTLSFPMTYSIVKGLDYDFLGVGEIDIDNPSMTQPRYRDQELKEKTICANLIDLSSGAPIFTPYKIINKNGLKIAILGMVSPANNISLPDSRWRSYRTQDMIECAQRWMPEIKAQNPDVVIGLFHSGMEYDKDGMLPDAYMNPNGGIPVAMYVPGFDVILLGGDNNPDIRYMKANDGHMFTVVNIKNQCYNAGLIRIQQTHTDQAINNRIVANIIDLSLYEQDKKYLKKYDNQIKDIYKWLNTEIGYLADTLTGYDGIFGPTTYRSLLHLSQFWNTNADISICNAMIGGDTLLPGPITIQNLFHIYPAESRIMLLDMTGYEVKRYLEYSFANQFKTISSADEDMLIYKLDKKGHTLYNLDGNPYLKNSPEMYASATGIRYTVDITKPAGQRITITSMADGSAFSQKKNYRVAISSNLASEGSKMITEGVGWNQETLDMRIVDISDRSMRDIVKQYIIDHDTLHLHTSGHWKIIPEDIWQKQKENIIHNIRPVW